MNFRTDVRSGNGQVNPQFLFDTILNSNKAYGDDALIFTLKNVYKA